MNKKIIAVSKALEVETIQRGRYTMVSLKRDGRVMSVGIARTGSGDKTNSEKGHMIALGRARRALYSKQMGERIQNVLMG